MDIALTAGWTEAVTDGAMYVYKLKVTKSEG